MTVVHAELEYLSSGGIRDCFCVMMGAPLAWDALYDFSVWINCFVASGFCACCGFYFNFKYPVIVVEVLVSAELVPSDCASCFC